MTIPLAAVTAPSPPRIITVPEPLWISVNRALHDNQLTLHVVATAPSQARRYELHASNPEVSGDGTVLSDREMQVLAGMSRGETNAAIGCALRISEDTVKTHVRRMFTKIGARDRAHAVAIGCRAGWVS